MARVGRPQTSLNPLPIIILLAVPRRLFCFGSLAFRCGVLLHLVSCFEFNDPLRQYFSLYRAVSQREGERGEK